MFYHNIDPVLFSIGPLEIRYYGLIYALGFLIAYLFLIHFARTKRLDIKEEDVSDLLFYLLLGVVLGARVFYILFYDLSYFLQNPFQMIALWKGGLSLHCGLAGAALAIWLFCRKRKIKFYDVADALVFPVALALMLGRIGNFLNGELYGRVTEVSWCVNFSGVEGCRHPSQIYESFKNLLMFAILWLVKDQKINGRKLPKGFLFWSFVILYSVFRFVVEFFRQPDAQLGFVLGALTMGQVLNILMFAVGSWFMVRLMKTK